MFLRNHTDIDAHDIYADNIDLTGQLNIQHAVTSINISKVLDDGPTKILFMPAGSKSVTNPGFNLQYFDNPGEILGWFGLYYDTDSDHLDEGAAWVCDAQGHCIVNHAVVNTDYNLYVEDTIGTSSLYSEDNITTRDLFVENFEVDFLNLTGNLSICDCIHFFDGTVDCGETREGNSFSYEIDGMNVFNLTSDNIIFFGENPDKKVGFGQSNPTSSFHLLSNDEDIFMIETTSNPLFVIKHRASSVKVGINTDTPNSSLHIVGNTTQEGNFSLNTGLMHIDGRATGKTAMGAILSVNANYATPDTTIFGVSFGGSDRFEVDEGGDGLFYGDVTVRGQDLIMGGGISKTTLRASPFMGNTVTLPISTGTLVLKQIVETITGSWNFNNGVIEFAQKLGHYGDTNTYMEFIIDGFNIYAGGRKMIEISEAVTDNIVFDADTVDIKELLTVGNTTTGVKAGSDLCIGSNSELCICGSCS